MILVIDADASKVIEAVRSTGVVITRPMIEYAHYLISNMKNIGTWQLSNAVYGFVGGTANSHAINWKTIGTYNLTYGGGVTHSLNGIQGNGTTGYADTGLKLSSNISATGLVSFGLYTNSTSAGSSEFDMGAFFDNGTTFGYSHLAIRPTVANFTSPFSTGNTNIALNQAFVKGYYQVTQNGVINAYLNGLKRDGIQSFIANVIPNSNYQLMCTISQAGGRTGFSNKSYSFNFFSAPLTDTQAIQQSQIVTNAQNILNRA